MMQNQAIGEAKNLNPASMLIGIVPWVAFSFIAQRLSANGIAWAALLSVILSLLFIVRARATAAPILLDLYSLVLFGVIAVVGFVGGYDVDLWLYHWGRPLVGVVLGLTVLLTAYFMPFTAEYAKRSTPREYWDSPVFKRINFVLSAGWGVAIAIMGMAAVVVTVLDDQPTGLHASHPADLVLNWVVPIAIIAGMIHFTNTYPDRVKQKTAQPRATV